MARKSNEEKLQELELRMKQLQNQKKQILAKHNAEQRKKRNHRLIEIGAEVEAALGYPLDTREARKALGDFLRSQESRGEWVSKAIKEALQSASQGEDPAHEDQH